MGYVYAITPQPGTTYTVTFNAAGGSPTPDSQVVNAGEQASEPTVAPTREGYDFLGWFNGSAEYDFNSAVTSNLTLVAHWQQQGGQAHSGTTLEDAFTAEEACAFANAQALGVYSTDCYYITDVVTSVDTASFDANYGTLTFNLGDFVAFRLKNGSNHDKFTSADAIQVGDTVTIYGQIVRYGTSEPGTPEMSYSYKNNIMGYVYAITPQPGTTYTVTFNAAGGSPTPDSQVVNAGEQASAPTVAPTREGYDFLGWFNGSVEYDFNSAVNANITLTAHWQQQGGGTGHSGTTLEDAFTPEEACDFARSQELGVYSTDCYYIKGAVTSVDTASFDASYGTLTFNLGEFVAYRLKYSENQTKFESADAIKVGDVVILYGQIVNYGSAPGTPEMSYSYKNNIMGYVYAINPEEVEQFTVSFSANGGSGTMADIIKNEGATYALPECTFTAPEGKEFAGWKVNGQGDILAAGAVITISADVELVAQWKDAGVVQFTVSFSANGGTGTMASISVEAGEYELPACTFTAPEGKEFAGWKVNGEGNLLAAGAKITVSANVELVAQWKDAGVVQHTISFDANGGTGEMADIIKNEGATYALPECTFTAPEGKEFAGWKVGNEATLRQPGSPITVNGDVTVVAQWKDVVVTYTVSFAANGGTGTMADVTVTTPVGEAGEYELPACAFEAPEGKEFAGWKVNGEGDLLAAGAKITLSANVQLVAQWKDAGSEPVDPEPTAKTVDHIVVTGFDTLNYVKGQELDLSKIKVEIYYTDGTHETATADQFLITGYNKNTLGQQTITLSCEGQVWTAKVIVTDQMGCHGSIIAGSALISLTTLLGAGLLMLKKRKEDK